MYSECWRFDNVILWLSGVRCTSLFGLCEDGSLDRAYNYPHRKIYFCEGNPKQGLVFCKETTGKKEQIFCQFTYHLTGIIVQYNHGHSFIFVADYKNPLHKVPVPISSPFCQSRWGGISLVKFIFQHQLGVFCGGYMIVYFYGCCPRGREEIQSLTREGYTRDEALENEWNLELTLQCTYTWCCLELRPQ